VVGNRYAAGVRAAAAMAVAAVAAVAMLALAGPAGASGRPCGPGASTHGFGSMGSAYTLKSKHDDDGPGGSQVVGEEFEIAVPAGQVWTVVFADNGQQFFAQPVLSTADGLRAQAAAPNQPGNQTMSVHAVSEITGEVIDASLVVPPAPNCGR
jgi:hypothetical protein